MMSSNATKFHIFISYCHSCVSVSVDMSEDWDNETKSCFRLMRRMQKEGRLISIELSRIE